MPYPHETGPIVVPHDFSDMADEAVHAARAIPHTTLHVVHVVPALPPNSPAAIAGADLEQRQLDHARDALTRRLESLGAPEAKVHVTVCEGNPAGEVAQVAQDVGAALVVTPSHGRTGLRRLLIGSVAERTVRLCHCPVLVLRH